MWIVLILLVVLCLGSSSAFIVPPAELARAPYPEWAHYHWVWLSARDANQTSSIQLVNDYLSRDIPVGAVNIDSSWQTGYNSLQWNTKLYPNASNMIEYFHSLGVRVIAWATSMVDTDSPNYNEGKAANYYLNNGTTIKWWHGTGSFIDYTNPEAVDWWHSQMDVAIDMGLDGWKCDGTDPYVIELVFPFGKGGFISEREYADYYYRDFFYYTKSKNPQTLIMARPVDDFWSFAPHDVMFSGWVGDQDPTFKGLRDALTNVIYSAWRGYLNFGSDTGGYRLGDDPPLGRTKELLIRWAQANCFLPLFENGGENEHRPWMFDTEGSYDIVDIYRYYVLIHTELSPYLLSSATEAYAKNVSTITPSTPPNQIITEYEWMLGPDYFISAITDNSTSVTLTFPKGNNWVGMLGNQTYTGGSTQQLDMPLERYPAFKRVGSIIPLQVTSDYSSHGDSSSSDALTVLLQHPFSHDEDHVEVKNVYEFGGSGMTLAYNFSKEEQKLKFKATAHKTRNILLLVRGMAWDNPQISIKSSDVEMSGNLGELSQKANALTCGWSLREAGRGWCRGDGELGEVWIRPGAGTLGVEVEISAVGF